MTPDNDRLHDRIASLEGDEPAPGRSGPMSESSIDIADQLCRDILDFEGRCTPHPKSLANLALAFQQLRAALQAKTEECAALQREVTRHVHGQQIESDYICPHELALLPLRDVYQAACAWVNGEIDDNGLERIVIETDEFGRLWCSIGCQFDASNDERADIDLMDCLAANLSIAGALCEAFALGWNERLRAMLAMPFDEDWRPGCRRPARPEGKP